MTTTPVWVDLLIVSPVFEDFALVLLGKVGKVIYAAPKYAQNKYSNICGCVRVDLMQPIKDFVIVEVQGIGDFKMNVDFCTLPNACFYCKSMDI